MEKTKWYNEAKTDSSPVISARVRLARNLKKYPFSYKITDEQSKAMINEVIGSVKNEFMAVGDEFEYRDLSAAGKTEAMNLLEKHIISPEILRFRRPKGVLIKSDESVDIMINEEDHIRIQAIIAGEDFDGAYDLADKIDDLIEESLEYAYHKDFGYLTSCPTNTGTGLRASAMMHLPLLEKTGRIPSIQASLSKIGMALRGTFGEGTNAVGGIYQISNQMTMGKSEAEIIKSLKTVVSQISQSEYQVLKIAFTNGKDDMEDGIFRALGILSNARKISLSEAVERLSSVRIGILSGVIKEGLPQIPIYNIMMNCQPGNLQNNLGFDLSENQMAIERAKYLRKIFKL